MGDATLGVPHRIAPRLAAPDVSGTIGHTRLTTLIRLLRGGTHTFRPAYADGQPPLHFRHSLNADKRDSVVQESALGPWGEDRFMPPTIVSPVRCSKEAQHNDAR